jgi:hypothetical protein
MLCQTFLPSAVVAAAVGEEQQVEVAAAGIPATFVEADGAAAVAEAAAAAQDHSCSAEETTSVMSINNSRI